MSGQPRSPDSASWYQSTSDWWETRCPGVRVSSGLARQLLIIVGICLAVTAPLAACNIPVFRYALERWQADHYQLVVLAPEQLSPEQLNQIESWRKQSASHKGPLNLEVVVANSVDETDPSLASLRNGLSPTQNPNGDPVAILRSAPVHGERQTMWQGKLLEFELDRWFTSPVRQQLVQRLLAGDSGVWLVFPGADPVETRNLTRLLRMESERLGNSLPFPSGIGEAGSELYSEIPFTIRFSVLEVQPEQEEELRTLFKSLTNVSQEGQSAFAVPVYGRGRALEAFDASMVTPQLIEEVSLFLTGACSCQVKQSNPGFDLPLNANWLPLIFGDMVPPAETLETPQSATAGQPSYVSIPGGNLAASSPTEPEKSPQTPIAAAVAVPAASELETEGKLSALLQAANEPASVEILSPPSKPVVISTDPFPLARWIALGSIALGCVVLLASLNRR